MISKSRPAILASLVASALPCPPPQPAGAALPRNALHRAWRRSYAGLAAIGVFSTFINLLKLATPIYLLQVLDRVIASRSHETLLMLTALTLVAIVTGVALEIVRHRMLMAWGDWIERRFAPVLFAGAFDRAAETRPAASSILRDVATLRAFVAGRGLTAWLDVVWAPFFIACVLLIAPVLGAIVVCAVILTVVLGTLNELITRTSRDATFSAGKEGREWVVAAERNQETVATLGMATNLAGHWSRSATSRLDAGLSTRSTTMYFESAMRLVGRCLRIGVLAVGIWLVIGQSLTLGAVFAAGVLGRMAYSLVERAMMRWRDMARAGKAYRQIKACLQRDAARPVSVPRSDAAPLVIDNLSYRHPNQRASLFRGMTVTVKPGEVLCVIGPSAAGKSTFTRLASGFISPREGNIRLGEVEVFRLQQVNGAQYVGYLPQSITLFSGTVRENIAAMATGDLAQVMDAARRAGVHETILKLPAGYDTEIGDGEPLLSAGQRKKLALARAFYGAPPLIVLDEPYPHLDNVSRAALRAAIAELTAKGSIVIVTTQTKPLSRIADKVILFTRSRYKILQTAEEIAALRRRRSASGDSDKSASRRGAAV